jgi:hypothetical protein
MADRWTVDSPDLRQVRDLIITIIITTLTA